MTPMERQIVEHEGFVSYVYPDTRGFLTIGFGRMVDHRLGGGITLDEGLVLLRNDITKVEHEVARSFRWFDTLDVIRRRVVLDMAFNLGLGKLIKFHRTLDAIGRGDWSAAAEAMRQSLWAAQVGNRAERLARMMETGEEVPKWW